MITLKQNQHHFDQHPFLGKLTVVLENGTFSKQVNISDFLYFISSSSYLAFLDDKTLMIPFLSVEDNLLLGLSKKERNYCLSKMPYFLSSFKLDQHLLKSLASDISYSDQLLFQMIRSISLKQPILIFDNQSVTNNNQPLLTNLLPVLQLLTKSEGASAVIVTKDFGLIESIYYDQCIF